MGNLFYLSVLSFSLVISNIGIGQTAGDYRSAGSSSWSALSGWQRFNGSTWVTPTTTDGYPGQKTVTGIVTIKDGHSVTLDLSPTNSIGSLVIGEGGSSNAVLTLNKNDHFNLTIDGNLSIQTTGRISSGSSGTVTPYVISIKGNFTNNSGGTVNLTGKPSCSIVLNGSGTQNIGGTAATTFYDLTTQGISVTTSRNINVTNNFSNSGNINLSSYSLIVTNTITNTGTIRSQNTSSTPLPSGKTWGGTVQFDGAATQTIPAGTYNTLILNNSAGANLPGNISATNLNLTSGSLNINGNTLTLGTTTGSGTLNGSATSSLVVTATGSTLNFTTGSSTLKNLTINSGGSTTLGTPLEITGGAAFGTVTVNGTLNTGGNLTFKSDANGTAVLGNSTGTITGNVTVERYIAGRRAYRQLAAGVNTTGSIRANWQNEGSSDLHNGIHITGSTTGANGFDATGSGAANMFTYTPGSPNYTAIANTDVLTLNALQGYRVFVYGDRGENLSVANTVTSGSTTTNKDFDNAYTVLKATGTLVTGTVTYNSTSSVPLGTATGSYSLIANPYWSPVSFDALSKSGIDATYWVWDPTVGNRGAYISWTTGSGSAGGLTTNIQPGQAIFVRTNGASPSLTFSESNKTSTQSTKGLRLNNTVPGKITVQLFENSRLQNNQQMQDATAVAFDDAFAATIGNEDAAKFANSDENIGIVREAQLLGIEGRPIADGDVIPLRISRLISNYSYSLKFNGENLPAGTEATLEDLYDNKTYPINVTGTTVVPFSFNSSDNATFYERFRIVMKKSQAAPLPFSFTNLTAIKQGGKIQLDWSVANETGVTSYEVERSADGVNYTVIVTVNTIANNGSSSSYAYTDAAPLSKNSYRIKANLATEVKYSNTVTIAMGGGKGQQQLLVYPNPVAGRGVSVQMNELASGNYVVRLYNPSGQQIYQKQVSHQGGAFSMPLQIPHASVGMYTVEVSGAATQMKERIIVQQ